MKRIKKNKPKTIECKLCNEKFSSYGFPSHIKNNHTVNVETYIKLFGEFRATKPAPKRRVNKVECKICHKMFSSVGMYTHLRDTHNMSIDDYKLNFGEYNKKYVDYHKRADENKITCLICNNIFGSERLLTFHVKIKHELSKLDYVKKYVFNGKQQLCGCGCGCGNEVKLKKQPPYKSDFISGHNGKGKLNGMFNKTHNKASLKQMSQKAIERVKHSNKTNTLGERKFKDILEQCDIKYIHQYELDCGVVDFYLPEYDLFVEIDGTFWHSIAKECLNFQQVSTANSEFNKQKLDNLLRISDDNIDGIFSVKDMIARAKNMHFSVGFKQKIITKEYLRYYKNTKGLQKLRDKIYILLKFVRNYQTTFPYPECEECLDKVVNTIQNYDFSRIYADNVFRNNISNVGVNYLKSNFKSYWHSKYNGSKTPIEAWNDDDIMRKVIEYRIGLNNSNEVFDFTMHQLIQGLSARRYTISFFKPLLAAAIYKHFLGNNSAPTVIDPCAGFGGRMLGFKSVYPEGTYIGIEPNRDTFEELMALSRNFSDVELHNCKVEDFNGQTSSDLTFTSIPYFDTEVYSKNMKYKNTDEWKNNFIRRLMDFDNLAINTSIEGLFDYKNKYLIRNNTSHFNKKSTFKYDYIYVCR